jgi:hypothetical protein
VIKEHSQAEEYKRRDSVSIQNEIKVTRGTHFLESTERGTFQDTERKLGNKGNSLPREHKWRHLSEDLEDGKKTSLQRELTL